MDASKMDSQTLARYFAVQSVAKRGNQRSELAMLWKSVRQEASQIPALKNPVCAVTDHYQRLLTDSAIVLLSAVGVDAESISGRGYPCVRILGVEISY